MEGHLSNVVQNPFLLPFGREGRQRQRRLRVNGKKTLREAIDVSDEIMTLCGLGEYDGLVAYLADQYLPSVPKEDGPHLGIPVQGNEPMLYSYISPHDQRGNEDILGQIDEGNRNSTAFPTNSFAWRGLLFDPPVNWERTSVFQVVEDRCLVRYLIRPRQSGEEMFLCVDMRLQDALRPTYRSIQIQPQWFLHGLLGESCHDDVGLYTSEGYDSMRHMRMGPEAVTLCQLDDLKNENIHMAWSWNSTKCKQVHQNSVDVFMHSIQDHAQYQPLLAHSSVTILKSIQISSVKNMTMVGVESSQRSVFLWMMTLEDDCMWRVDAINCLGS